MSESNSQVSQTINNNPNKQQQNNLASEPLQKKLPSLKPGEILGTRMQAHQSQQVQILTPQTNERQPVTIEKLNNALWAVLEKIKASRQLHYAAVSNATITLESETISIGVISNTDLQILDSKFKEWFKKEMCDYLRNGYLVFNYFKQEMSQEMRVQTESEKFKNLQNESDAFKALVESLELVLEI